MAIIQMKMSFKIIIENSCSAWKEILYECVCFFLFFSLDHFIESNL